MEPRHGGDTLADGGWLLASLVVVARWPLCGSWGRHARRCATTGGSWFMAERVHHHVPVHGGFWKNFLSWVCSRCSHLKIGALFLFDFVSGSLSAVSGCCMWNTDYWILREMTLSMGAMLGSTMDMGSATVLGFWTYFTHFLRCGRLES